MHANETSLATSSASQARVSRRIYLPTLVIAAIGAWPSWRGWILLSHYGIASSISAGRYELAGPVVLGFVFVVTVIEQLWPAQRRPLLARGHLLDVCYLLFYALLVIPLIVLLGAGFSTLLAKLEPWLVLPRLSAIPSWCFVVVAVLGIDAMDWLAHVVNHKIDMFWRFHAVHHSQEELSILTTYRAHPLVHVSFLFSAIPILAVESNAATPAVVLTVYACLGALPHANVRWTYGIAASLSARLITAFTTGLLAGLDINLGTIFTIWDAISGRAVFPAKNAGQAASVTGLAGRPIPVEQAGRLRLGRTMLIQLAEPFTSIRTESR